jgi:pimeloyl-ACP methyl ester carboxylesterase
VAEALPKPAFWMGHSLGGAAIYGAAASMKPLRCLGLVGLGAVFHFGKGNFVMQMLCQISHKLRHVPMIEQIQVKTRLGGDLLSKVYGITDILGYTFPLSGWWPGSIESDLLQERLEKGFDWTSVKVWLEMARWGATGRFDYEEEWKHLNVPLLVVLGDKDHLLTPESGQVAFDTSSSTDKQLLFLDDFKHEQHWGHLDLTIGHKAPKIIWTRVSDWMTERVSTK